MVYRVLIEKGEDFGYVAHCPAIPGCHSQGETIEEAIENIKDAINPASRLWIRICCLNLKKSHILRLPYNVLWTIGNFRERSCKSL